jgi:predicted MFS family arabinose efflux permease
MVALGVLLAVKLPRRVPQAKLGYLSLIGSMGRLLATQKVLQRRAAYQAFQFSAFSLFWTVTPLYLASPAFGLTQTGIALFALAGVAGAIASPIAGRLADKGLSGPATAFGLASALLAFVITLVAPEGSWIALALLTLAAILVDFGVTTTLVTGQRAIYSLGAELRSRLNGLFMAIFFTGGAIGSAVGAYSYAHGGWTAAAIIGAALPLAALLLFLTERNRA